MLSMRCHARHCSSKVNFNSKCSLLWKFLVNLESRATPWVTHSGAVCDKGGMAIVQNRGLGYHDGMNRRLNLIILLVSVVAVAMLLSSCVVAQKLTFTEEDDKELDQKQERSVQGQCHVDIAVDDFFVGVIQDLSNWDSVSDGDPILDFAVRTFEENLRLSDSVEAVQFLETGHNTYMGDFTFTDFWQLVRDLTRDVPEQTLVRMEELGDRNRVEFNIDMDNFAQLTRIIPFLGDPNFEVYGPLYNHDLTQDEYLEMVSFILGDECPEAIARSQVRIQVVAPSPILSHNGRLRDAQTVEFSFPLIDFLLLHQPINFYLEY